MNFLVILVLTVVSVVIGFFVFRLSKKSVEDTSPKKKRGKKKQEKAQKENEFSFTTLEIDWKEEDTKKYIDNIWRKEKHKPLKIEFKYPHHYVLPSQNQFVSAGKDGKINEESFVRFMYQPYFHPGYETLCGVVRFGSRCQGPSVINDQLETNAVNGGASLTFGIEMIQLYLKILDSENLFTKKRHLDIHLNEKGKKLEDVEIEYLIPIPLEHNYRFDCSKDKLDSRKYEVAIIGLGSQRQKYAIIRATVHEDEDDGMYNFMEEESENLSESQSLEFLKKNKFPPNVEELMDCLEETSEKVTLNFYDKWNPSKFQISPNGDKYVLPQYYLASLGQFDENIIREKGLLRYEYAMVNIFFQAKGERSHFDNFLWRRYSRSDEQLSSSPWSY